ncbi:MAG TPA: hypothetical protein ENJ09_10095 [Planctomycetes bacterium]|nr:hypothetical protein [Planctomycetota bacterium]
MAILVRTGGKRRVASRLLLALMALSSAGCLVFDQLGWGPSHPTFSHRFHVADQELECIDCHTGYEESDQVAYPRLKSCMLCHADFDEEADPAARPAAFYFEDGSYRVTNPEGLDLEIKFSHLEHVTDEDGCLDCHADVVNSREVKPWMAVSMQDCVDCHEAQGEATTCATCHNEVEIDIAPRTHDASWDRMHGLAVRDGSDRTVDNCSICHEESTCVSCHEETMPQNHNNFWRSRGHGLTARMDRDTCAVCHGGPDYCDRCHTTATPLTHTGLWAAPRNNHCLGCHTDEPQQSCYLCHQSGAPSHALAPPKPVGHDPLSDCRECHTFISHADNGDDCNICHN